jgi:hypothetical protein
MQNSPGFADMVVVAPCGLQMQQGSQFTSRQLMLLHIHCHQEARRSSSKQMKRLYTQVLFILTRYSRQIVATNDSGIAAGLRPAGRRPSRMPGTPQLLACTHSLPIARLCACHLDLPGVGCTDGTYACMHKPMRVDWCPCHADSQGMGRCCCCILYIRPRSLS